ncbi:MAG: hypothetical protein CfClM3_0618 [Methanobrevibacter sp. CfCl-M3]
MRHIVAISIILIASLCIIQNIDAKIILTHGNGYDMGVERLGENIEQTNHANDLLSDRFELKESIKCLKYELNESNNDSEPIVNDSENDTITIYGYPSSWQDNLPYRLYKTVWLKSVLDICQINPKGTFEGELTRICDDMDFSLVTGLEKDFHGDSISEYLVSVE